MSLYYPIMQFVVFMLIKSVKGNFGFLFNFWFFIAMLVSSDIFFQQAV